MEPLTENITIPQGNRYAGLVLLVLDGSEARDLTGDDARMQLRKRNATDPAVDLTAGDGLELGADGRLIVDFVASSSLPAGPYRYDIELYPGGDEAQSERLVQGVAVVTAEVTR
jgi:hypothetical protein